MTRRYAPLLLTAALGMAAAQTASPSAAPTAGIADRALSGANVTFTIRRTGSDMTSMLVALAKSAGYEVIIEPSADEVLRSAAASPAAAAVQGANAAPAASVMAYDFTNKPFNEVWPLVLDIYGLSYENLSLGGKTVLRVGIKPIQRIVRLPAALEASDVERQLKLAFGALRPATAQEPAQAAGAATVRTSTAETIELDSKTMRIVAEPSSNSVIIRGTNQEVAQVQALLTQIIAAQAAAPTTPSTAQRIVVVNGNEAAVTGLLRAQFPNLRVTPVGQDKQLVLSGTQAQLDAAAALLAQVDRPVAAVAGSAQQVYAVKGQQDDAVALLAAQFPALKVTPVGKTGQLVINGPQDQLASALALLTQVDRPTPPASSGPPTVQRVFQLVNASAEEVKATLEGTLSRELGAGNGTNLTPTATLVSPVNGQPVTGTTSPAAGSAPTAAADPNAAKTNAATLIADKRTNTLIVRGTAEQVAQVAELVPQLDTRVPQINVQVRIQEITEKAGRSLGLDWKANFGGFQVSAGSGGLGASFDPTRSLLGFNLFPTLQALQNQGLSKSIYDGTVTMQSGQRALGSNTDTQNASSTAAASVKSGGRLEINLPSGAANVSAIQKQIDYGINLDFYSPQVAPDGTITLRVRGQINDLTTPIASGTLPYVLQFVNSEAQTTLTLKNGETVLLSGLLKTKEQTSNDGVPILSSIPVVGALFGKQATTKEQTQLLVVITGNVLK